MISHLKLSFRTFHWNPYSQAGASQASGTIFVKIFPPNLDVSRHNFMGAHNVESLSLGIIWVFDYHICYYEKNDIMLKYLN